MIAKEKYLPTKPSPKRCFLLIGLITCIYLLENTAIRKFIDSRILNFIIRPSLWIGLAYLTWLFPRIKPKGLLKLRGTLNWWAFNFAVIYIMVSGLAGVLNGFGKSPYDHSVVGIITNVLVIGLMIMAREFVRSYLVNSFTDDENYLIFIIVALFMTITSLSLNKFTNIAGYEDLVKFMAQYFVPEFCQSLFATYLVFLGGPITSLTYLGIVEGFNWLSPILPDLRWITRALIGVLCPIFFLMTIQSIYLEASKELKKKDKDEESPLSWMITSIISIGIIWFSVGVFPIYPSVVATGSMEPMIKPGDVILVKKVDGNNAMLDDVIQFRRGSILISHRIIDIQKDEGGNKNYRTKGDNNSGPDIDLVSPSQVKGKIIHVVPKIGWPTLLIKSKRDGPLEGIEF